MKKIVSLLLVLFISLGFSQEREQVPTSKSLVGIWQLVTPKKDADEKLYLLPSPLYKVINYDNTFYTFATSKDSFSTILMYGEYEVISDTNFTEVILFHNRKLLNHKKSELRYELVEDNFLIQEYRIENGSWIPEIWKRLGLSPQFNKMPNLFEYIDPNQN